MYNVSGFERAWNFSRKYLFYEPMCLFYDGRQGENADTGMIDDLPTPEEISLSIPNDCGWGTGMEDSVMNNGSMLEAVILRYKVTGDESLREYAKKLYRGLRLCAEVSDDRGFLARSVSPFDGRSHYINSSRDQYTHWIYCAWLYFHSELSDDDERASIARILTGFAERAEKNVTEENGYNLLDEKGNRALVCEMWGDLEAHEAMRLPMIYAAAMDVTGDEHWREMYMRYRDEGLEKSKDLFDVYGLAYALLQMQYSLRLIYEVDDDECFRQKVHELMNRVADRAAEHTSKTAATLSEKVREDFRMKPLPWRKRNFQYYHSNVKKYFFARYEEFYSVAFRPVRNAAEAIIVQTLCPDRRISEQDIADICRIADFVDYEHNYFYAPILVAASFWGLRSAGYLG